MQEGTKEEIEARGHRVTRELFEQAAALAWKVGTSGDPAVENYASDAYRSAWKLTEALYFATYQDATAETWERVSDLLSELGPDDGYNRVDGHGVDSYHRGALLERAETALNEAADEFIEGLADLMGNVRAAVTEHGEAAGQTWQEFKRRLGEAFREQMF